MDHDIRLYTVRQAAAILGIGRTKTYELMHRHDLRYVKVGRCRRVASTEIARYVRSLESASDRSRQPTLRDCTGSESP